MVSTNLDTNAGVPQGNLLDSMLFALNVHYSEKCISNRNCYLFAEDAILYIKGENMHQVIMQLMWT